MLYNFVVIHTETSNKRFGRKILRSVKWINEHYYPQHDFRIYDFAIGEFLAADFKGFVPANTIIHPRCAHPYDISWVRKLKELEGAGYKVINPVDTLKLTSNKVKCALLLQGKVNHPKSWEYSKNMILGEVEDLRNDISDKLNEPDYIIAKPLTSIEQGANVRKIDFSFWPDNLKEELDKVPGNTVLIQEYIPYTALHRVIVIGGKALPYTFIDKPEWHEKGDWKVSCCLNKTTMQLDEYPSPQMLELAEQTQKEIGGIISFIDIFEYEDWDEIETFPVYTISEINTACSLNIHERLAKAAGRKDWNIHYRIAKQLVKEMVE